MSPFLRFNRDLLCSPEKEQEEVEVEATEEGELSEEEEGRHASLWV